MATVATLLQKLAQQYDTYLEILDDDGLPIRYLGSWKADTGRFPPPPPDNQRAVRRVIGAGQLHDPQTNKTIDVSHGNMLIYRPNEQTQDPYDGSWGTTEFRTIDAGFF